jgi:hypothetical protein
MPDSEIDKEFEAIAHATYAEEFEGTVDRFYKDKDGFFKEREDISSDKLSGGTQGSKAIRQEIGDAVLTITSYESGSKITDLKGANGDIHVVERSGENPDVYVNGQPYKTFTSEGEVVDTRPNEGIIPLDTRLSKIRQDREDANNTNKDPQSPAPGPREGNRDFED